jgi:hypothetical protein
VKNIPASTHARLQNLAKNRNKPFQEILKYYGMERFLFRLSQTKYGPKLILKGGLIFYALDYPLKRATRDIDFRGYVDNSVDNLIEIIKQTCSFNFPHDGLVFRDESIKIKEKMVDFDYPGFQITFDALLGSAIIHLQIDIGFFDVINPGMNDIHYLVLLDGMEAPIIKGYPPESIISEKFQARVRLADINSRWKDFYDIWMLSELKDFEGNLLQEAISATFKQRQTPIPKETPKGLTESFAEANQRNWERFLSSNKMTRENIQSFNNTITQLRLFLILPIRAIVMNEPFQMHWRAGSDWS